MNPKKKERERYGGLNYYAMNFSHLNLQNCQSAKFTLREAQYLPYYACTLQSPFTINGHILITIFPDFLDLGRYFRRRQKYCCSKFC